MIAYRMAGLTELLAAERTTGAKVEGALTNHLLRLGGKIAEDVKHLYAPISIEGGYGVQAKVFTSGLWVVQTLNKSRDLARRRPNFGPMMYRRAFLPAAQENEERIVVAAELAYEEATAMYWR